MYYAIGCRSGLNDSEGHKVTCGITPQGVTSWSSYCQQNANTEVLSQYLQLPVHSVGNEIYAPGC